MRVRLKNNKDILGYASQFNTLALSEVNVYYDDGSADSEFCSNLEIYIEAIQTWMDMNKAFKEKYIIPDNYNEYFAEPKTKIQKERGYI